MRFLVRSPSPRLVAVLAPAFLLPILLAGGLPARAAPRDGIAVQFRDRDIREVLRSISAATGQTYIFGDDLAGKLTITVPHRVSRPEAIALLDAALYLKGFVALPTETGARKVLPLVEAASGAPRRDVAGGEDGEGAAGRGEQSVTTLMRLESAEAGVVVDALKELVGTNASATAFAPTNSVVLTGTESQVRRLILLARNLDAASGVNVTVHALRYRDPERTAELIDQVFNATRREGDRIGVWPEARSGRIAIRAKPDLLPELRAFLEAFDVPEAGRGDLRVVRVLNRDPEEIAETIRAMVEGGEAKPRASQQQEAGPEGAPDLGEELAGRDVVVEVDANTRSLLIRTDPRTLEVVLDLIARLDRLPARIGVEVLVVEFSHPSSLSLGFDALLPLLEPSAATDPIAVVLADPGGGGVQAAKGEGDTFFARYTREPVILTVTDPGGGTSTIAVPRESASFAASGGEVHSRVLIHPQIVVTSGDEHEIFSGNNVPIPVAAGGASAGQSALEPQSGEGTAATLSGSEQDPLVSGSFAGSFLTTRQQIQREDVGVRLRIQPKLGETGVVDLGLELEISEVGESSAGDVESVGPSLEKRRFEARMKLSEGQYAVVGSSTQRSRSESRVGVPFLMRIPVIGLLFSRIEKSWVDTEIVALVHARVLRDPSDDTAESIRRRIAFQRSLGRLRDLSDPAKTPYAVRIDVRRSETEARRIAEAFASDGFATRVREWEWDGVRSWDVYVTGLASLADAGELAMRLADAGWDPEVAVLAGAGDLSVGAR